MQFTRILTAIFSLCFIAVSSTLVHAQRISDHNDLTWLGSINTISLGQNTALRLEYHWRRTNCLQDWQTSVARIGLQQRFRQFTTMVSYVNAQAYPYGEFGTAKYSIPEHRITEEVIRIRQYGRLSILQRLRLDQRFIAIINQKDPECKIIGWNFAHRATCLLALTLPINNSSLQPRTFYITAFDELFVSMGSNVQQNVFNQNRAGLLAGYTFSAIFRLEAGLINQIVHQPALNSGLQVFRYNNGFMVNSFVVIPRKSS